MVELPQWIRELAAVDQPVYAGRYWVPDGFPEGIPRHPDGSRCRLAWIGVNDERERWRAEVWIREASGRFVKSVWLEKLGKWSSWRVLNI